MPDGTKPLLEPMLTSHQWGTVAFTSGQFHRKHWRFKLLSSGILLIGTLGTNFSDILSEIYIFSFRKMHLKMSAKWRAFCLCFSVLKLTLMFIAMTSSSEFVCIVFSLHTISCDIKLFIFLQIINTLRPRQNGHHFPNDTSQCIFLNENVWISIRFNWSLFLRVQSTIFQHWFRYWLGAKQVTSYNLK